MARGILNLTALLITVYLRQICCFEDVNLCNETWNDKADFLIPDEEGINIDFVVHKPDNISEKKADLMLSVVEGLMRNMTLTYTMGDRDFYNVRLFLFGDLVKYVELPGSLNFILPIVTEHIDKKHNANVRNGMNIPAALGMAAEITYLFDEWYGPYTWHKIYSSNVCFLLIVSSPDNSPEVRNAAKKLQDSGVTVVVVAIGDVDMKYVVDIASNKHALFTTGRTASVANDINNTVGDIIVALRQGRVLPRYKVCHSANVNFFIIVDMDKHHIQTLYQLRDFFVKFNLERVSMRVMIIDSPVSRDWYKRLFQSLLSPIHGLKIETLDSSFDLATSIRYGRHSHLNYGAYNKYIFHEKIVIIATDKYIIQIDEVMSEVHACQERGIHVMALGIGKNVSKDQLSQIISDPRGMTTVETADDINYGLERLNRILCASVCEDGAVYHNETCFRVNFGVLSMKDAKGSCSESMSKPVSITSEEKSSLMKFAHEDVKSNFIIGLQRKQIHSAAFGLEFRWENGKPLIFSEWYRQRYGPLEFTRNYGPHYSPSRDDDNARYTGNCKMEGTDCLNVYKYPGYGPEGMPLDPNSVKPPRIRYILEPCFESTPNMWREFRCPLGPGDFTAVMCEKDAGNKTQLKHAEKLQPLWEENSCSPPESGQIISKGDNCRPLFHVHVEGDIRNVFSCTNGELISIYNVCDGLGHCLDGSDEANCSTECTKDQFSCDNGRCVSLAFFCDFWDDCGDNSDEADCVIAPCPSNYEWQCQSGQCIPGQARCDLYFDCYDRSDEESCIDMCRNRLCEDGSCIPWHWFHDGIEDTEFGADENPCTEKIQRCYTGRYRELYYLFANAVYENDRPDCCMVFDGFGKHLESGNCSSEYICPIGFYRCPTGYCIPVEKVCDGVMDCIDGEEEDACGNYECPGYYRCPFTTYCHHPARVCDGDADCPGGRDEVICDFTCPDNCTCFAGVVECNNVINNITEPFHHNTKKIIITETLLPDIHGIIQHCFYLREAILIKTGLSCLEEMLNDLINLRSLNVSHNNITTIKPRLFSAQRYLKKLDISHNPLSQITSKSFVGLTRLEELIIRYSSIATLQSGWFSVLVRLKILDVTGNSIHAISDGAFTGLKRLNSLHMQENPIAEFGHHIYDGLYAIQEIKTDIFSLCCPQVRPWYLPESKCVSPISAISSCNDLLANNFLRASIWLLCISSLVGNVVSIIIRFIWERVSMRNGFGVFVTHLGISDFFMGIYLLTIAIADLHFQGIYIWHDFEWRQSYFCTVAGITSTISSEASTFFICLITLDRFLVIKFPFGQFKFRYKSATACAICAWLTATGIAVVPLVPSLAHWNFYSKNAACLALPFSTEKDPGWIYPTVIFIGVNFLAFIIIAFGQLSIYRAMKKSSMVTSKERIAKEMAVARRLIMVVVSDFCCWFPIGIMSVLALSGISISGEVYAWSAVFILPVNSALNPFLYTIPAVMQRMRNKKSSATHQTTETTVSIQLPSTTKTFLNVGDPDPDMMPLETVLKQQRMEDRYHLILDVMGAVKEHMQSDQPQPNAIYLSMHGKRIDRICLATKTDVPHADPVINTLALLKINEERKS